MTHLEACQYNLLKMYMKVQRFFYYKQFIKKRLDSK